MLTSQSIPQVRDVQYTNAARITASQWVKTTWRTSESQSAQDRGAGIYTQKRKEGELAPFRCQTGVAST